MECTTKVFNVETQEMVEKPKKAFETNELAIKHCKIVNALPNRINKVVPYKCHTCHQFHVGRNGSELTKKYLDKLIKPTSFRGFKIVGNIKI